MLANKKIKIYFLYLSLFFLALLFNINPSGGAKQDYQLFQEVIKIFSANVDLKYAKFFFNSYHHSPVFYIFAGLLQKIFNNFEILRIINILISSLIPYIFFLVLRIKYKINNFYIFFFIINYFLFSIFYRYSHLVKWRQFKFIIFFIIDSFFF